MAEWTPSSWRQFPAKQQAPYPDAKALKQAHDKLRTLPGLVSVREIEALKTQLADVAAGKRFLLQGGDCAERFQDCQPELIEKKLKIMIQMSLVLVWGARMPTVRVARMAGQFAKPRSSDTEVLDGEEVVSFRGENINGYEKDQRTPDPNRLLEGYFHSAATLNYGRVLVSSGFADIHDAAKWDLDFVQASSRREEYQHMVNEITDSLHFVHMCGVGADSPHLKTVDLFVSHEGLELAYEETMTRKVDGKYYNVGTDFLWIGDRTRQLDHAHIEYFRGIENPIGIKVGPSMAVEDLVPLIRKLWKDPEANPGKITLITRYGSGKVADLLPKHIAAVKAAGLKVIWSCDPCHGNTIVAENGYKTRPFDRIFGELEQTLEIHREAGTALGGVHFELTGENVTECIGGPQGIDEGDLPLRYTSYCDPRLNYSQSMEVAFLLAKNLSVHHDLAPLNEKSKMRKRSMEISDPSKRQRAENTLPSTLSELVVCAAMKIDGDRIGYYTEGGLDGEGWFWSFDKTKQTCTSYYGKIHLTSFVHIEYKPMTACGWTNACVIGNNSKRLSISVTTNHAPSTNDSTTITTAMPNYTTDELLVAFKKGHSVATSRRDPPPALHPEAEKSLVEWVIGRQYVGQPVKLEEIPKTKEAAQARPYVLWIQPMTLWLNSSDKPVYTSLPCKLMLCSIYVF
ncbi:unnamed protein product [Phytophthora fragariaefolia]|uniref:Phospho-2-dehydro-3-deoxyheptonate aldolase n=1 Tax=Phytophthora fragariaefolia TaxID=1490495 RepID=A0A9W7D057_9STRA|nr:unnamed protein product [Phytophthora fragariaefolia]